MKKYITNSLITNTVFKVKKKKKKNYIDFLY